jgi:hypothetical protein
MFRVDVDLVIISADVEVIARLDGYSKNNNEVVVGNHWVIRRMVPKNFFAGRNAPFDRELC